MLTDVAWIRAGLAKPGKTQSGLAKALGRAPSMVSEMLKGKRELKAREVHVVADYLEVAPPVGTAPAAQEDDAEPGLTALTSSAFTVALVSGTVEAGAFREVDPFDQRQPETVLVRRDRRFPRARVLAFRVEGDSMNAGKLPLPEGSQIICVAYEDVAHELPLRNGLLVVVQRERDGGQMREWSVKAVRLRADRVEFQPRSTNPKHKPIVTDLDFMADDGTTVEVIAVVRSLNIDMQPEDMED